MPLLLNVSLVILDVVLLMQGQITHFLSKTTAVGMIGIPYFVPLYFSHHEVVTVNAQLLHRVERRRA